MNKNSFVILGIVVIILGLSFSFGNFPFAKGSIIDSDSKNLNGIDKIVISGSSEDIRVHKSNRSGINAELKGKSKGFSFFKPKVDIDKSGKTITVSVKRRGLHFFTSYNLELDVYINDNYNDDLSLNILSGKLVLEDKFEIEELKIDMSSGEIIIPAVYTKNADIDVSSGRLVIEDYRGNIEGKISSGDINIEYFDFSNNINFSVSSGNLDITFPEDSDFELDAKKSSGNISTEFLLSDSSISNNSMKGIVGNGENMINLDISSGNINIISKQNN
jgi:lia operon protein LiaG